MRESDFYRLSAAVVRAASECRARSHTRSAAGAQSGGRCGLRGRWACAISLWPGALQFVARARGPRDGVSAASAGRRVFTARADYRRTPLLHGVRPERCDAIDVCELRALLEPHGESLIVAGQGRRCSRCARSYRTAAGGGAALAAKHGRGLERVKIDDMAEQHRLLRRRRSVRNEFAVVAVVPGRGVAARIARELGAEVTIPLGAKGPRSLTGAGRRRERDVCRTRLPAAERSERGCPPGSGRPGALTRADRDRRAERATSLRRVFAAQLVLGDGDEPANETCIAETLAAVRSAAVFMHRPGYAASAIDGRLLATLVAGTPVRRRLGEAARTVNRSACTTAARQQGGRCAPLCGCALARAFRPAASRSCGSRMSEIEYWVSVER